MAVDDPSGETTVNESYSVTVPARVRDRLDIEPGDKLRWTAEGDELSVEVVKERHGAFSDLEPIDVGEPTDAATDHDLVGEES